MTFYASIMVKISLVGLPLSAQDTSAIFLAGIWGKMLSLKDFTHPRIILLYNFTHLELLKEYALGNEFSEF
ncbi:MAG: hypothetical protein LBV23_10880, partial [Deltaproteobacteria bacterium]|nr:hypothetical protein [Deltaproteobacteria bacterium]